MSLLDDLILEGRSVIGAPYGWWGGGELERAEPMYLLGNRPHTRAQGTAVGVGAALITLVRYAWAQVTGGELPLEVAVAIVALVHFAAARIAERYSYGPVSVEKMKQG